MTARRFPPQLPIAVVAALPGTYLGAATYLGLPHPELVPPLAALVYGIAIIGAAFVLSWAAEAAQVDISAGLALAVLALLAVLPEYAVDFVFSFQAGQIYAAEGTCPPARGREHALRARAGQHDRRQPGARRRRVAARGGRRHARRPALAAPRRRRQRDDPPGLRPDAAGALGGGRVPGIATLYSLALPLRHTLTLLDAAVLVAIFCAYAWRLSKAPAEEPDLQGTSAWVGGMAKTPRRVTFSLLFLVAALVILACAEHFAEGLVQTGEGLGVDPFILVQWVAPLASEAPELIVACLFAWRLKAADSLGTLLSSKVNQWTLLVGTIPIVFAISAGTTDGLPLDAQQRVELLLTAAQSLFAVSILITLALTTRGAAGAVRAVRRAVLRQPAARRRGRPDPQPRAVRGVRGAGRRPARPAAAPAGRARCATGWSRRSPSSRRPTRRCPGTVPGTGLPETGSPHEAPDTQAMPGR